MDRINRAVRAGPPVNDLVTRAGNGDKQAWDTLVERYAPLIWSICRRHRLSSADARVRRSQPADHRSVAVARQRDPAAVPGQRSDQRPQGLCPLPGVARGHHAGLSMAGAG
jgi:hypothetical protein